MAVISLLWNTKMTQNVNTGWSHKQGYRKSYVRQLSFLMLSLIDEVISQSDLYKAYSHVNIIVFFIGYPRSRHSLLGSLLDAHPHMVISDETMAFNRWKARTDQWMQHSIYAYYDTMFMASHRAVSHGRRSRVFNDTVVNKSSAYGYYVPNQWQGGFDTYIEVNQLSFFFFMNHAVKPVLFF